MILYRDYAIVANPKTGSTSVIKAVHRAGGRTYLSKHDGPCMAPEGFLSDYKVVTFVRHHVSRMIAWACWQLESDMFAGRQLAYDGGTRYDPKQVESQVIRLLAEESAKCNNRPGILYGHYTKGADIVLKYEDGVFNQLQDLGIDVEPLEKKSNVNIHLRECDCFYTGNTRILEIMKPYVPEMKELGYV